MHARWAAASALYPGELLRRSREPKVVKISAELVKLEDWVFNVLPAAVRAREPASLTLEELVRFMTWKRAKCGDSFGNLGRDIQRNTEDAVRLATETAFALAKTGSAEGVMSAITALCRLSGVGPATASGLLSALDASVPFLTDAAAEVLLGGPAKFRATEVQSLLERCRALSSELGALGHDPWTARRVELATWAAWRRARAGLPLQLTANPLGIAESAEPIAVAAIAPDKRKSANVLRAAAPAVVASQAAKANGKRKAARAPTPAAGSAEQRAPVPTVVVSEHSAKRAAKRTRQ